MRRYSAPSRATSGSSLNRLIQRLGQSATTAPIVPQTAAIVIAPVQAIRRARPCCPAPQFVPALAPIAVPNPKATGWHDVFEARPHGVADGGFGSELPGDPGQ